MNKLVLAGVLLLSFVATVEYCNYDNDFGGAYMNFPVPSTGKICQFDNGERDVSQCSGNECCAYHYFSVDAKAD